MDFYNIEKNTFATEPVLASKSLPVTDLNAMLAAGYVPVRYDYPAYDPYVESVVAKIISAAHYDKAEGMYVQEFDVVDEPEMVMQSLADARQSQLSAVNAQYDAIVAMAKVNTPDGEVLTWDIQKTEAEEWAADNSALTPFIDGIAQGRGMDRVVLIEKVLVKTAEYRDFVAIKTGIRQGLEDAIFAAETVEDVQAIVWPVGDAADASAD